MHTYLLRLHYTQSCCTSLLAFQNGILRYSFALDVQAALLAFSWRSFFSNKLAKGSYRNWSVYTVPRLLNRGLLE